ncbi:MAG: copper-binding protein [Corticimicrobacter sp.]|uniref:copper-binding protein n=1 Tax=Corticimicrobacter sp. TaxID=2678536 RepID=UPI0032DB549E
MKTRLMSGWTCLVAASLLGVAAWVPASTAWAQQATASGEVRRTDAQQGKITIKHEAIAVLELPAMTLVYQADPAELAGQIKPGDRVTFTAERRDGKYVVIAITVRQP